MQHLETRRPRKSRKRAPHLAKVGSPANQRWEHRTRVRQIFGPRSVRMIVVVLAIVSLAGIILVTL